MGSFTFMYIMTTIELSDYEIDEFLHSQCVGVLSLSSESDSYAVPVSYTFDSGVFYFHLLNCENSDKQQFIENTDIVTFTVFEEESHKSVICRGELEEPEGREFEVGARVSENSTMPTLDVYPNDSVVEDRFFILTPDTLEGRHLQMKF